MSKTENIGGQKKRATQVMLIGVTTSPKCAIWSKREAY